MATTDQNSSYTPPAGVTLDMSKSKPVGQAPAYTPPAGVQLDMSKSQPVAPPASAPAATDSSVPDQPGVIQRGAQAIVNNTPLALIKPPETPTEQVIHATAGDSGLAAYRAAKGLVSSVENVVKSGPEAYANAVADYQRMHQDFINKDYRNAASSAGSLATDVSHVVDPTLDSTNQTRQLTEGARPGADLTTPLVGQIAQAGTAMVLGKLGTAEPGVVGEAAANNPLTRMITNPFRPSVTADAVQPELQANLKGTWDKVADENNVPRPTATSIRDYGEQVADAILARSKTLYRAVDEATGNRFSGTAEKLQNVVRKMRTVTTDAEEQALMIEKTRYEMQIDQMFDDAAKAASGVTKSTVDAAKATFKKAQAIYDANQDVRMATKGIRPGEPGAENSPETVNSQTLQNRLNKRQDSGRLAEGVGGENGRQMIGHTGTAAGTEAKAAAEAARVAKNVGRAKTAAKGAAIVAGVTGAKAAMDKAKELAVPTAP